ncbi:PIN domain-containing protein [Pelomicrobium methylotrophicum]|nr:hypothetical protein [Pelomicrobium methylotrophicum]
MNQQCAQVGIPPLADAQQLAPPTRADLSQFLLRVLVDDGSPDVAKARDFVAARSREGHDFHLDAMVLAETVRVLDTVFGYGRTDISTVIDALLGNAAYLIDGREAVASALARCRATNADFADRLIVARNMTAGCKHTASLDRAMQHLPSVVAV